jgi:hypothetical protein
LSWAKGWSAIQRRAKTIWAALLRTLAVLLALASFLPWAIMFIAVGYYVLEKEPNSWQVLIGSLRWSVIIWLVAGVLFNWLATPNHAIPDSHAQLLVRMSRLRAKLTSANIAPATPPNPNDLGPWELLAEIDSYLSNSTTALEWLLGTGYTHAWMLLHRAEEATIDRLPQAMAAEEAVYDELRLDGSDIPNGKRLLESLRTAIGTLCPRALKYLNILAKASDPLAIVTSTAIPRAVEKEPYELPLLAVGGSAPYRWKATNPILLSGIGLELSDGGVLNGKPVVSHGTVLPIDLLVEVMDSAGKVVQKHLSLDIVASGPSGRFSTLEYGVLRTVREAINEYRDGCWNGLIVARNHLYVTMFRISLVALGMLALALLWGASRSNVLAAGVFYLVGAFVGLLKQLQQDSEAEAAVDDEGLAVARVLATPIFGGLSAIAGVVIIGLLPLAGAAFGPAETETRPLVIVTESQLPPGVVDSAYCQVLVAEGGVPPYRWEPADSAVVRGVVLNRAGALRGTPKADTVACFEAQVLDDQGRSVTKAFKLEVRKTEASSSMAECSCVKQRGWLDECFDLRRNILGLVVAAVFGLTPGLIFEKLMQQQHLISGLKSSEVTEGGESFRKP